MNDQRNKSIYRVTLWGAIVNFILVALKFVAGILGHSAAMIADAVHSLSDLLTDFIVVFFVRISSKPADEDHHYGHGKYETLATLLVGGSLLAVGVLLLKDSGEKIVDAIHGNPPAVPGAIAFGAAVASIVLKEFIYRVTVRVGREVKSDAVIANAWHHRTDALSSIGTGVGIGGALLLGSDWAVLDPIAASVVSILILFTAIKIMGGALNELLEKSLPKDVEASIRRIVEEDTEFQCLHNLRTRSIGNVYSIEMHLRMDGNVSLFDAHQHSVLLERRLREAFGQATLINLHIEPLKTGSQTQTRPSASGDKA